MGFSASWCMLAEGKAFSPALSRRMMDILHGQEFNQGIPARLPKGARVAHKTGEISTVAHDAGVVYLPETEAVRPGDTDRMGSGRDRTVANDRRDLARHLRVPDPCPARTNELFSALRRERRHE